MSQEAIKESVKAPVETYKDDGGENLTKVTLTTIADAKPSDATPASNEPIDTSIPTERVDPEKPVGDLPAPNFDDFLKIPDQPNLHKEPVKKPDEVKPDDIKSDDKSKAQDDKTVKPIEDKVARDYTGFTEDEQKLLSKMSNDTFAWVLPKLNEYKQLGNIIKQKDTELANLKVGKQVMPDSYYEHPNAYTLDPAYTQEVYRAQLSDAFAEHWQEQMINVKQGKPWRTIDVEQRTGQLKFGPEQQVEEENKARIEVGLLNNYNHCTRQAHEYKSKIAQIQSNFSIRHQQNIAAVKQTEDKYFKVYDDAKHPYNAVVKQVLESIPVEFRGSPLSNLLAKTTAGLLQSANTHNTDKVELAKWRSGKLTLANYNKGAASVNGNNNDKKGATSSEKKKQAGPTDSDVAGTGLGNAKNSSALGTNFDDFSKILES